MPQKLMLQRPYASVSDSLLLGLFFLPHPLPHSLSAGTVSYAAGPLQTPSTGQEAGSRYAMGSLD